ncbi:MAG: hypothetical protein A3D16_05120 [Rhodobacterales bacterium RIFCSPHIGHO2_02_FULL_62_130]|nr:MAG: hypothetical protein A3D16_05120 [Rhodobacterales bacterium RIFCSPHIGHO2_02_FULL_62_130]OHC55800.1 MAG: hypothetical protein A3E48_02400 [Rhodobacterales bacterium RIFCSPHIGHO2_12_FULL_62_75]
MDVDDAGFQAGAQDVTEFSIDADGFGEARLNVIATRRAGRFTLLQPLQVCHHFPSNGIAAGQKLGQTILRLDAITHEAAEIKAYP